MLLLVPASSSRCPRFYYENMDVGVKAPALSGVPGVESQLTTNLRPPPLTLTRSFCIDLSIQVGMSKMSKWMIYRDAFSSFS